VAQAAVSAACLNVINKAQDIYSIVDTTISETQTATRPTATDVGNTNPLSMLKKRRIRIFRSSRTDVP
jgi:hypothetical protein